MASPTSRNEIETSARDKQCTHCSRSFKKREHLIRHLRAHTKERPYTCTQCGKSFMRSDVLRRHERGQHLTTVGKVKRTQPEAINVGDELYPQNQPRNETSLDLLEDGLPGNDVSSIQQPWPGVHEFGGLTSSSTGDDFDFNSLDGFLNDLLLEWAQSGSLPEATLSDPALYCPPRQSGSRTPASDYVRGPANDQYTIDEQYSNTISRHLVSPQQQWDVTAVPSAATLSLYLRLYFTHFHPIFPVIHAPTFRPRAYNALLLTSMCSIGSLFAGGHEAVLQGHHLYARLNKAILASWESHISQSKSNSIPMIQAALLGQTFGLLSGRPADRFMTEMFHGTMLTWARSVGAFDLAPAHVSSEDLHGSALQRAWATWIRAEEVRRLASALYVHDIETATLFNREPYLRHENFVYYPPTSDEQFAATSAEAWQSLNPDPWTATPDAPSMSIGDWLSISGSSPTCSTLQDSVLRNRFTAYGILCNVGACITERHKLSHLSVVDVNLWDAVLKSWYLCYMSSSYYDQTDTLSLRILWHLFSLQLYADIPELEAALKNEDKCESTNATRRWAMSKNTASALLHASLLHKHATRLQLGAIPALHLPRALFAAGVVFAVSLRHYSSVGRSDLMNQMAGTAHIDLLARTEGEPPDELATWAVNRLEQQGLSLSYSCIDLLRKLNQWGVSNMYSDKLEKLVRAI